ncbi:hypothetical protein [Gemmobacter lutimaris]|nr:hypothetical protein [Gemmobacter lutimaris]
MMDYYPSPAAKCWQDRIASMVQDLPDALDDRAESQAAAIIRGILADQSAMDEARHLFQRFDLARRTHPAYRQADFRALSERAAAVKDEVFAMSDAYANAFGALARAGRLPDAVDSAGTANAFGDALDALDALHRMLAGASQAIHADVGADVGGPAITAPPCPAIEVFAQGLAHLWIGAGRTLSRADGKMFAAVLRVAQEVLTGEAEIKSEDRLLSRIRAWANSA